MADFWQTSILDNTIQSYLMVAGTIVLVLFLKRYLSRYVASILFLVLKRVNRTLERGPFIDLVVAPLEMLLLVAVTLISLDRLTFPAVLDIRVFHLTTRQLAEGIATITMIGLFTWFLLRLTEFIALMLQQRALRSAHQSGSQLVLFFKDFFKVIVGLIGALMILHFAFNVNLGSFVTGLSLVGAAVALATKESLENLIASFVIFSDKPFTTGDYVKVNQFEGTVERIGLRSTRIRTDQKTYVTVPNKQMVDSVLDNQTLRTQRKAVLNLLVSNATGVVALEELVAGIQRILHQRNKVENATVFLQDVNKDGYMVHVEFFSGPIPIDDFNQLRQGINLEVIRFLEEKKVSLASSSAQVVISTVRPVEGSEAGADGGGAEA